MPVIERFIIKRKCDEPMRRSKERCNTAFNVWWKCSGDCKSCICGMYQTDNGEWHHNNFMGKQLTEK